MTTPHLNLPHIAQGQSNKETTANIQADGLDDAQNGIFSQAVTGSFTLTAAQFRGAGLFRLTGTPGLDFTMRVPASINRHFGVQNLTDSDVIVETTDAGTDFITISKGQTRLLYADGSDVYAYAGGDGAGGNFVSSRGYRGYEAGLGAAQTSGSAAAATVVDFSQVVFDTFTSYNVANDRYDVPPNLNERRMIVMAQLDFAADETGTIAVFVNGTEISGAEWNTSSRWQVTSKPFIVNDGDLIDIRFTTADGYTINDSADTWVAGYAVDPIILWGAAPFLGFQQERSGDLPLDASGAEAIEWDVESFDNSGGFFYNTEFVVPAKWNGRWMDFRGGAILDAPNAGSRLQISRDTGSGFVSVAKGSFEGTDGQVFSKPMLLVEGHVYRLEADLQSAGTLLADPGTFFSGHIIEGSLPQITLGDEINASADIDFNDFALHAMVRSCVSASTIVLTVEPGNPNIGSVKYHRGGAGNVQFDAGSGVSLLSVSGFSRIDFQYQSAILTHIGGDVYWLEGPLKA